MEDYTIIMENGTRVPVEKGVYEVYKRMHWREEWGNRAYNKRTISLDAQYYQADGSECTLHNLVASKTGNPEEEVLKQELWDSLKVLPEIERTIVYQIYACGYTQAESAKLLGKTRDFVQYHKDKALEKMRNYLVK